MKKLLNLLSCSLLCSLALSFAPSLSAQQSISVKLGPDYPRWTNGSKSGQKVGYALGASYGYMFSDQFEVQLEMFYREASRRNKYDYDENGSILAKHQVKMHGTNYMVNMLYHINHLSLYGMTYHVGVGLGWQQNSDLHKIKSDRSSIESREKDDRVALQAIVGVSYPIEDTWTAIGEYKYLTGKNHVKQHGLHLGIVKSF